MLPIPYAELMAGVAAGLIIWILVLWTPLVRDLFAAVAAAGILDVLIGNHASQGTGSIVDKLAAEISGHPYFGLGLVAAASVTPTLLRILRSQ